MSSQDTTKTQVSAGGVAYRTQDGRLEIALISVGEKARWQLPKGRVDADETTEAAAMREVHEEAGIKTELVRGIEEIDYWFYAGKPGNRARIHKYVHFYLLRYLSGDPQDHDHEVNEARWVDIAQAQEMLAFESERRIVRQAQAILKNGTTGEREDGIVDGLLDRAGPGDDEL